MSTTDRVGRLVAALTLCLALSPATAAAAPGDLDPEFGRAGAAAVDAGDDEQARALAAQPDGRIVVAGDTRAGQAFIARLMPDGKLDPTFGGVRLVDGMVTAHAVAVQRDGRLAIAGTTREGDMAAHRVDEHGRPDATFGENGTAVTREPDLQLGEALAIQPDGKLVIAGATFTPVDGNAIVRRLDVHGQPDPTFGENGTRTIDGGAVESAAAVAVQADGKIVVAGRTSIDDDATVHRLDERGQPDPSFGENGTRTLDSGAIESAAAVVVRPDGTIVVVGRTNVGADAMLYGLTPGGELDPAFGDGGTVHLDSSANEAATSVALQADGMLLVAGASQTQAGMTAVLYRVLAGGARDAGFGRGGEVRVDAGGLRLAWAMAPQADGGVLLGGGGGRDALVVRLLGDDPPPRPPPPPPPRLIIEPPCEAFGICEPGMPATPPTPPAADLAAPRVTGLTLTRRRLRFTLSEPASARIVIQRVLPGRRMRGRCTVPTRKTARRPRCTRLRPARTITRRNLPAGTTTIPINARTLKPGRYRATMIATDPACNHSTPVRTALTIAKRSRPAAGAASLGAAGCGTAIRPCG